MPTPTDDFAPAASKAKWFAAFYLCIPVGFALGYIFGGAVTAAASWRWTFVMEGAAMLPFIAFALTAQPLQLRGSKPTGRGGMVAGGAGVAAAAGLDVCSGGGPSPWLGPVLGWLVHADAGSLR